MLRPVAAVREKIPDLHLRWLSARRDVGLVLYEDTLGEFDLQTLATVLRGGDEVLTDTPIGWSGDRFRVYRLSAGPALVWYIQWDDSLSASRFRTGMGARLVARERAGYRTAIEPQSGATVSLVRVIIAPVNWTGWQRPPALRS